MSKSLLLIAALTLAGCASAGRNEVTMPRNWIGPEPKAQYDACSAGARGHVNKETIYASIDGEPHSITYNSGTRAERSAEFSAAAMKTNACMEQAGYVYFDWSGAFVASHRACKAQGLTEQAFHTCMREQEQAAQAKILADRKP
jgi:hypothetical protein